MKKFFGAFIFAFNLSCAGFAGPLGLGLKAGVALDNQNLPHLISGITQGTYLGVTGGAFADIQVVDFLSVQPEVDFIQKGLQLNFDPLMTAVSNQTQVYNYLEFPLLLKLQTGLAPGLKGYLLTGPALNVLLNENITFAFRDGTPPESADDTKYIQGSQWSLTFGGGVELEGLILDIRYDLGLDSATETSVIDRTYGQLNALTFELGYRLL